MILLVRVDDRLLHGQLLCSWIPFMKADMLVVVSDEVAKDSFKSAIIRECGEEGLNVVVKGVSEVVRDANCGDFRNVRAILVVRTLKDAMRLYEEGLTFSSLNIGNIHHGDGDGRMLCPSVILNKEDEEIIEKLKALGVKIDIRDLPTRTPVPYIKRENRE